MADVDPDDVTAWLDRNSPPVEQVVPIVTTLARAYTRGNGFTGLVPNDEIAAVITTASARLAGNTTQLLDHNKVDDVERDLRSTFQGWSLAEQYVLNRYRVTAL